MRELETIQVEVIDVKEGLNLRGGGQVKGGNDRSYTVKNQMIVIKMKLRSNPSRSLLTQYLI